MFSIRTSKNSVSSLCVFLGMLLFLIVSGSSAVHANWLFSYPPNQVKLDSGRRNHVFYVGDAVKFKLDIFNYGTYKMQGTVRYEVRDYWGSIVDQGTTPAPTPGTSPEITLNVTQPGWYKIYLHGPTAQAPWGDSVGGTMFVIFRQNANFPTMPSPTLPGNSGTAQGGDEVARGVLGMGPQRHFVSDASNPAQAIPDLQEAITLDKQYYTPFDPQRGRVLMVEFPNGIASSDATQQAKNLAGLKTIVQQFRGDVKYWEPLNEPNFIYGNAADYVNKELKPFYDTVKSVDPSLKVMGPAIVTIGPYGLSWLENFFKAGGANYIDAFSFHAYNNVNGDLILARKSLDGLNALLTKYGVGGIEKWQTEQGYFAACYGAYQPRLQGRWTMLQMMVYEQYGIPKEHNHLWYDKSHGFWDFPSFWENEDGPYAYGSFDPAAPLMRVWSEELFGTNFASAYDLGAQGNKMYVGSLFKGAGKQIAAFMSNGRTDGSVTLKVTGGTSIHVVSAFGVAQDLPISGGQVTLPVPELPVYVELTSDQTLKVVPIDFGANLALLPGVTVSSSGTSGDPLNPSNPNDISKIINGVLENWYYNQGSDDHPWMDSTSSFPAWVQITLPSAMPVNHVVIYAGVPWQSDGSLLDYDLQYDNNGQWVTLQHVQEPTNVVNAFTSAVFTTADSFYSDRCVFQHDFPTVTTQKLRLLVRDTTWGGGPTAAIVQAGGQTGPHQIELREVEVYNNDGTVTVPKQTGQVRYAPRLTCESRMIGGKFQGSSDGVNYTTLYTVTAIVPAGVWTTVPLATDPKAYRYLRFLSPDGAYGNIAELEFDSGTGSDAVKITGTGFGTAGFYANSGNDFSKAIDGNLNTYFDAPAPGNGDFVGIDQGGVNAPAPPPAQPTGLRAVAGVRQVTLTWNAVSGATSYNLYRANSSGKETLVKTGITTNGFLDAPLTPGASYYYRVSAVNNAGEGAQSDEVYAVPLGTPPTVVNAAAASPAIVIAKTTNLSVLGADEQGESGLTYTWNTTSSGVSFSVNGTNAAKNTTATFTAAGTYAFQVTLTNAAGLTATSSVTVVVNRTLTQLTVSPNTASVAAGGKQAFVASGLDQFGGQMDTPPALTWSVPAAAGSITSTGLFTAASSASGQYTIQAASGSIVGSATVTITTASTGGAPPAQPTGLRAVAGVRQVTLTWNAVSGATSYNLYRANSSGKETLVKTGITTNGFLDAPLTPGASYYYRVSAVNNAGEGFQSDEASTYLGG